MAPDIGLSASGTPTTAVGLLPHSDTESDHPVGWHASADQSRAVVPIYASAHTRRKRWCRRLQRRLVGVVPKTLRLEAADGRRRLNMSAQTFLDQNCHIALLGVASP